MVRVEVCLRKVEGHTAGMDTITRQEEQKTILEEAEQAPGVAEVIEVYGHIAPFAGLRIVQPGPMMGYATGGNC